MNPTTQTPTPDYSFILNQQAPEPPKKANKKILLAVCGVVLIVGRGTVGLVRSVTNNVTPTSSDGATALVDSFNDANKAKDYTKSASITGQFLKDENKANLAKSYATIFNKLIDPNTCQVAVRTGGSSVKVVEDTCTSYDKKYKIIYSFVLTSSNGQYVVTESSFRSTQT